jgi:hypothetical protein
VTKMTLRTSYSICSDDSAICIIDDDELFEMWCSIEVNRLARFILRCNSDSSLPRVSFETNPSAASVLKAIAGEDYVDPLYILYLLPPLSMTTC